MTEIRKRKPKQTAEVEPITEPIVTVDTQTIEIPTDPSLLYPPKRAMDSVGLEPIYLTETRREEPTGWKKHRTLIPIYLALTLVVVTIIALSV